jgi:MscS family membrane protein
MPDFWNLKVLDNPLSSYIIVAATILFVIALKRFISRLIARFLFRFVRQMGSGLDRTSFLDLVVGPIGTFLVVFVSMSSIEKLHFPASPVPSRKSACAVPVSAPIKRLMSPFQINRW